VDPDGPVPPSCRSTGDINIDTGEFTIRAGKGRKDRTGYLLHGAHAALTDWLTVRHHDSGALFCPIDKAGTTTVRAMTTQAVYARDVPGGARRRPASAPPRPGDATPDPP